MSGPPAGHKPRLPGGFSLPPFGIHQLLAAVIVCVALWTVAVAWLGMKTAERWIASWQQDVRFHVYVEPEQVDQIQHLVDRLREMTGVASVRVLDAADKQAWLKAWLGDIDVDASLLSEHLPHAIEIEPQKTVGPFLFDDVRDEAQRFGAQVNEEEMHLARAHQWLERIRLLALFAAAILALAMAVIISNTLRMTLLARAEEVHLMRLLGAHEWFVRLPFILEGMLLGAGAGLVAWLLLWPLVIGIEQWLSGLELHAGDGLFMAVPLLFGGGGIGCLGALIATASLEDEVAPD